ncbi:hypothetical protein JL721_11885 [Aureococcus anophagefferens]|nr:hypothetical protein JL721_11885 [Aureococcus anophagefferens]
MAGDDDPEVVKDFNLAVIQASSGDPPATRRPALFRAIGTETAIAGLNGFVHKNRGEGDFYAWDESLPSEETAFSTTRGSQGSKGWLESCKRNGTATYGLLIPIILVKILAAFVVYRRAYAEHDTWRAKVAGVAVEAGCFVALLGITIEFYATCWRALPNRGKRMVFPGQPNEDKVQEVWVNVASVGICLAGLMSLVMSPPLPDAALEQRPRYGRDY